MYAILYLAEGEIVKPLPGFEHDYIFETKEEAFRAIKHNRVCVVADRSSDEYKQAKIVSFLNSCELGDTAEDLVPHHLLEIIEV